MKNTSKGSGAIVGILIVVVIIIVGWLAYNQGFFDGSEAEPKEGIEINLGANGSE